MVGVGLIKQVQKGKGEKVSRSGKVNEMPALGLARRSSVLLRRMGNLGAKAILQGPLL